MRLMDQKLNDVLEAVLLECAQRAPAPLYAAEYADTARIPRGQLDDALDRLRLGGLVKLTDWVQGRGQGYVLTPQGAEVTTTPRLLDDVRRNGVAAEPVPAPLRAERPDERANPWERGEAARKVLLEPRRPVVTATIIVLNLLVFLAGVALAIQRQAPVGKYLTGANDLQVARVLHDIGGLIYLDLLVHEWWRLLSSAFVHIGLLHLLLNMYFLYAVGSTMEIVFGPIRYIGLYLTGALAGGAAVSVARTPSLVAGASGALCGLLAANIVWLFFKRSHLPPNVAAAWMRNLVINAVLIIGISLIPGISAAGHFGGAVGGAVFTLPFLWERYRQGWGRWLGLAGLVMAALARRCGWGV